MNKCGNTQSFLNIDMQRKKSSSVGETKTQENHLAVFVPCHLLSKLNMTIGKGKK